MCLAAARIFSRVSLPFFLFRGFSLFLEVALVDVVLAGDFFDRDIFGFSLGILNAINREKFMVFAVYKPIVARIIKSCPSFF